MANLKPLIRLKAHQLDQKKRALATLYRERESLQEQKDTLLQQMHDEREALEQDNSIDGQVNYMRYAENVKSRVIDLDEKMVTLDDRISIAQDLMRDAFADLKRVEIIQERREDEEKAEAQKKEDAELDEIGLAQHRRQKKQREDKKSGETGS